MQVFFVDRKKLGVIFVVMGLMISIFCIGIKLDGRIRATAFIQNNLGELKEYKVDGYEISYKLPGKWENDSGNFSGNEVIYHNNFKSDTDGINGYVQVWSYNGNLKDFLDMSNNISKDQNKVKNFTVSHIDINGNDAYLTEYKINSHGNIYDAYEYFIKQDSEFIKFSFYINKNKANPNSESIFKAIVETVKK